MIGIYKIISPNNRIYIGQSVNIENRFEGYKYLENTKRQTKLYRSFKKYEIINHLFEIIEECKIDDLNTRERYWQDYYNVCENGLNCRLTATNDKSGKLSKETCKKIGISNSKKKNKRPNYTHSKETRLKISNANKNRFVSQEWKDNISKTHWNKKKVINILTNEIYDSVAELAKILNVHHITLCNRLSGNIKNNTNYKYYKDVV